MQIPEKKENQQRIVILGAGFAGLRLAQKLVKHPQFQIVLIDRNNYHQFQPLLYQVSTAGLEPSSISFPVRKIFQSHANIFIRIAEIFQVNALEKQIQTSDGPLAYDRLVVSLGASTNFFGNKNLERYCFGMKSVSEALFLRNELLQNYEEALASGNETNREATLNVVIVGGGPTGVELAGAIAEMRNNILPKDYPEIDFSGMKIYLIEAGDRLLSAMSPYSSAKALGYLTKLGVEVRLKTLVKDYDGTVLKSSLGDIASKYVVWAAGIQANKVQGLDVVGRGNRIVTDVHHQIGNGIYALGDIALTPTQKYPDGQPQVAPAAIQQADNLYQNLLRECKGKAPKAFEYRHKGNMATVGRNLAVVELPRVRFGGFVAWMVWMFVHLMSIVGVKNRLFVLINWVWNYMTYDVALRLIIKPTPKK